MTIRTGHTNKKREEGFALAAVIFVLALLGLLATTSLVTTGDERQASVGMRESAVAFYAAEAGANLVVADWDSLRYDTLFAGPGDTVDLGWRTLSENGAGYHAVIQRVDNGGTKEMYALLVEGRAAGAQRMINWMLTPGAGSVEIETAIMGGGAPGFDDLRLDSANLGGVVVSGRDTIPPEISGDCSNPLVDQPGTMWGDTNNVELENSATIEGSPPVVEDTTINNTDMFDWDGFNYDSLVAMATHTFTDDPGNIRPSLLGGPPPQPCDIADDHNWGAPKQPAHACHGHFPIIHAAGDMRISDNNGVGQGILLVDGDLRIEGSFEFYGIILVKGEVRFEDNVRLFGGLIGGNRIRVEDGAWTRYSQCAVNRTLQALGLDNSGIGPLGSRSWSEYLR